MEVAVVGRLLARTESSVSHATVGPDAEGTHRCMTSNLCSRQTAKGCEQRDSTAEHVTITILPRNPKNVWKDPSLWRLVWINQFEPFLARSRSTVEALPQQSKRVLLMKMIAFKSTNSPCFGTPNSVKNRAGGRAWIHGVRVGLATTNNKDDE